tara:strand:+ start:73 stop:1251 length:1179 start_codon:yes stop_codon:yes gene_type:complete
MSTLKVGAIRGVSASSDAITVANDGTASAKLTSINDGQLSGFRNLLINGAMTVNQRVTNHATTNSFNPVTSSIYTLDRWKVMNGSSFDTDSAKVLKSTNSPDGFSSSMKWEIGNTETPASNQNCGIEQKIEGQNLQGLAYGTSSAKTMTLSFHVRSNKTGTYCVHIMQEDGTKYQMHEYTINSSNTWEKKTITIVGNTTNAINDDNTTGIRIIWVLTVGSGDHLAATSTWASGGDLGGTSNQVNLWDNGSNEWYLTGCQLEIGEAATEYEHRSFGHELQLCQRYYDQSYTYGTRTGTVTTVGAYVYSLPGSQTYAAVPSVRFTQPMRAVPTVTSFSTVNADTTGKMSADGTDKDLAIHYISDKGCFPFVNNSSSGISTNVFLRFQYKADAEL